MVAGCPGSLLLASGGGNESGCPDSVLRPGGGGCGWLSWVVRVGAEWLVLGLRSKRELSSEESSLSSVSGGSWACLRWCGGLHREGAVDQFDQDLNEDAEDDGDERFGGGTKQFTVVGRVAAESACARHGSGACDGQGWWLSLCVCPSRP